MKASKTQSSVERRIIVEFNAVRRAAAVVLAAVLLAVVGQAPAVATDPQWEVATAHDTLP